MNPYDEHTQQPEEKSSTETVLTPRQPRYHAETTGTCEAVELSEHRYDRGGICVYCDRCNDPGCCEQVRCDRRHLGLVNQAVSNTADLAGVYERLGIDPTPRPAPPPHTVRDTDGNIIKVIE
jgi:hypothetical protein